MKPGPTRRARRENEGPVVVLTLTRRVDDRDVPSIRLMVSPETKLIRRIDAKTISGDQIQFDFSAIRSIRGFGKPFCVRFAGFGKHV
jgi:hypothetical protein